MYQLSLLGAKWSQILTSSFGSRCDQWYQSVLQVAICDHWYPSIPLYLNGLVTVDQNWSLTIAIGSAVALCNHWYHYTSMALLALITTGHQRYRSGPLVALCDHWYPWVPYASMAWLPLITIGHQRQRPVPQWPFVTIGNGFVSVDHNWSPTIPISTASGPL